MYELLNDGIENCKLLGAGLNENTMAIIKGKYLQVRGDNPNESIVRVYDCSRIISPETPCNFQNSPYLTLRPGDWYYMCERRQLPSAPSDNKLNNPEQFPRSVDYSLPYEIKKVYKAGNPIDGNQIRSI